MLRLGDNTPTRPEMRLLQVLYPALIGTRARSLYQNFLHSLDGPTAIGPLLATWLLVQAAILLKWIALNPELHGDLWFAQSDDRELTAIQEQQKHLGLFAEGSVESVVLHEDSRRRLLRQTTPSPRARPPGSGMATDLLPDLARMVRVIEEAEPWPQDRDAPELRRGLPHVQSVAAHGSGILQLPPRLTRTTAVSSATSRRTRSNT